MSTDLSESSVLSVGLNKTNDISANNVSCNVLKTDALPVKGNKTFLSKRALPLIPRKRPAPKLLTSSKEKSSPVEVVDKKCEEGLDSSNEPQQKQLKIIENASVDSISKPIAADIEPEKSSEDAVPSSSQSKDVVCKEKTPIKDSTEKIAAQRFIKKRVVPKLGNLMKKDPLKSNSSNDSADKSVCISRNVGQPFSKNEEDKTVSNKDDVNTKTFPKIIKEPADEERELQSGALDNLTPKEEPVVESSGIGEGIHNEFLNSSKRSSDNVKEYPVFREHLVPQKNVVEGSGSSIRTHGVVYCDLKSIANSDEISENWVCVNFNQNVKRKLGEVENAEARSCISNQRSAENISNSEKSEGREIVSSESTNDTPTAHSLQVVKSNHHSFINYKSEANCKEGKISKLKDTSYQATDSERLYDLLCKSVVKNKTKELVNSQSELKDGKNPHFRDNELGVALGEMTQELAKDASDKPYTLRQKKVPECKTQGVDKGELEDEKVEDIFSNSEDSDASEFSPEPEKKVKVPQNVKIKEKGKKLVKKKEKVRNVKKPRKIKDCVGVKEEKSKEKLEKRPKKIHDNPSAFTKLSLELKNKNKWDDDGNCAEPDKLELKDYIFFVPKNDPMSQESKKETKLTPGNEEPEETIECNNSDAEEEESHGPKLIVKDGKIMVDPNSTKLKQTPVEYSKVEKFEKPKEPNDPWNLQETMRFYATLWKYGIDFSMLAGTFPNKSRDSIKKKFNFEEKNNNVLLSKTLTKKLDIRAILRELVLIDRLMMVTYKRGSSKKPPKDPKKKTNTRHCLLPKKNKRNTNRKDNHVNSLSSLELSNHTQDDSNQSQLSTTSENNVIINEDVQSVNLSDIITFSTNVVYKDMNIVESVSFHPSAIQPIDVNVTIRHD